MHNKQQRLVLPRQLHSIFMSVMFFFKLLWKLWSYLNDCTLYSCEPSSSSQEQYKCPDENLIRPILSKYLWIHFAPTSGNRGEHSKRNFQTFTGVLRFVWMRECCVNLISWSVNQERAYLNFSCDIFWEVCLIWKMFELKIFGVWQLRHLVWLC